MNAVHETGFCFLLNQLLQREAWAREKLKPFAGERVEMRAGPLPPLRFTILESGQVEAGGEAPTLTLSLKREVEASGNAELAAAVLLLARHLRWDFEEDLSKVVGDVAAHRVAQAARDFGAWHVDTARRVAESLADYAADEKRVLVRRAEMASLSRGVAELRDSLERLAKRVERL